MDGAPPRWVQPGTGFLPSSSSRSMGDTSPRKPGTGTWTRHWKVELGTQLMVLMRHAVEQLASLPGSQSSPWVWSTTPSPQWGASLQSAVHVP